MTKLRNSTESFNSRLNNEEESMIKMTEYMKLSIQKSKKEKENFFLKKWEKHLGLVEHIQKKNYLHYENLRRQRGTESLFKAIMAENFSNQRGEMNTQIHKDQRILNGFNSNRVKPRHMTIVKN